MTTIHVPADLTPRLLEALSSLGLRLPAITSLVAPGQPVPLVYDPDLSAAEQATFDDALARVRSGMAHLTAEEYANVRPHIQTIRDLRQMGRNAFMALSAAERDRLLYDAQAATTTILLAVLRE